MSMKRFLMIFFIAACVSFSCTDDNLSEKGVLQKKTQLQLKSVAVADGIQITKSGTVSGFQEGDGIGLFIPEYPREDPFMSAVYQSSEWQLSDSVFLATYPLRLFAFYPQADHQVPYLPKTQIEIEHTSQRDYLYGSTFVSWEKPQADIRMKHLLALVQFKFIMPEGYANNYVVQEITIRNGNGSNHLRSRGAFDLKSGELRTYPGYNEAAFTQITDENENAGVLVIPMERTMQDGQIVFEFKINDRVYSYSVRRNTFWQAGMKYTYEVEIIKEQLKSTSVTEELKVVLTQMTERL